jgi:hypothetical protein
MFPLRLVEISTRKHSPGLGDSRSRWVWAQDEEAV